MEDGLIAVSGKNSGMQDYWLTKKSLPGDRAKAYLRKVDKKTQIMEGNQVPQTLIPWRLYFKKIKAKL